MSLAFLTWTIETRGHILDLKRDDLDLSLIGLDWNYNSAKQTNFQQSRTLAVTTSVKEVRTTIESLCRILTDDRCLDHVLLILILYTLYLHDYIYIVTNLVSRTSHQSQKRKLRNIQNLSNEI
jgi:hypothetical protein